MQHLEIIAQIMGIFGMIFISSSYLFKKQRTLIVVQLFGAGFFTLNFLLLGIAEGVFLIGALMNFLGVLRAIVFSNKEKFRADKRIWLIGFTAAYFVSYALVFWVFGTKPTAKNLLTELLPAIAMTSSTVAFFKPNASTTRKLGFITSPCWLVYDIINFSLGGIITEVLSLTTITVGIIKHDLKNNKNERQP